MSSAAALAVTLGAATLAGAAPATAAPVGCRPAYPYPGGVVTYCSGGTGEHRALCIYWESQTRWTNYGAWVPAKKPSTAWCPPASLIGGGVEVRD
ncbi:hypothetical protein [Streptosporangium sp. NPDC051022]|uniref:hypothetical protein n=1 Tax=Streptosporangium sp. NPDC051022 TaxID=3155752 RepID=UPI003444FCE3